MSDEQALDLDFPRAIFREYSDAVGALAGALDRHFLDAGRLILEGEGRLVVAGLGKSGHVARKLAATFSSTGTPALFLHLSEALHGDLGGVEAGDVAILISNSGETPELAPVITYLRQLAVPVIAMSSNPDSALMQAADVPLLLPAWEEVCPHGLAPTTSTMVTMAMGDALAMSVMRARGFDRADFQRLHPAGNIGNRLRPVAELMRRGEEMPLVSPDMPMLEAVVEMTAKRLGMVGVVDDGGLLVGVVTDGDLRRHLPELAHAQAGEIMTPDPKVVRAITTAEDALAMLARYKITVLFVVDDPAVRKPVGVIHIHDLSPLQPPA